MTEPYYSDGRVTLHLGDALTVARDLAAGSVSMICTSPPYYGLRDYGTGAWVGGDTDCEHYRGGRGSGDVDPKKAGQTRATSAARGAAPACIRCGAEYIDDQVGGEQTVDAYVERLVDVFRELRRVLADDGTLWLNLGDSYAANWASQRPRGGAGFAGPNEDRERVTRTPGFEPKQLLMIPARVAIAMQADGWTLRSEIIWAKPNPMPESVRDRPTKAHESLFLFAKSPRYYYNATAIAEPLTDVSIRRLAQNVAEQRGSDRAHGGGVKTVRAMGGTLDGMRNARDVWEIGTTPFPGAHFATFPEELPRRAIRAGARPAGKRCDCDELIGTPTGDGGTDDPSLDVGRERSDGAGRRGRTTPALIGPGGRPLPHELREKLLAAGVVADAVGPCEHPVEPAGIVLDPFSGSGTTGKVALLEGHPYIGIDLNREYLDLSIRERFAQQPLDLGALS